MKESYYKLVGKYTLLLAVLMFIEYIVHLYVRNFMDLPPEDTALSVILLATLTLAFNAVTAFVIYSDIKIMGLKTRYVILATVLYKPIGICAFLIYVVYDKYRIGG